MRDAAFERPAAIDAESIQLWCIDYIARTLNIPAGEVDPDSEFDSFGLDSAIATAMLLDLEEWLGIEIPPSVIFEQPTISDIAASLAQRLTTSAPEARGHDQTG